jgi:hypothetical protein
LHRVCVSKILININLKIFSIAFSCVWICTNSFKRETILNKIDLKLKKQNVMIVLGEC